MRVTPLASFYLVVFTIGVGACGSDTAPGGGAPSGGHGGLADSGTGGQVDSSTGGTTDSGKMDSGVGGKAGSGAGGHTGGSAGESLGGQGGEVPDSGLDSTPPPDTGVDSAVAPACVNDSDCGGYPRGCLKGICRDKCTIYINPCEWKPSGDVCHNGYCVECQKTADCPGTRYTCDTTTFTCVDKPVNPTLTKIGMFYHTWHCPASQHVHDLSQILAGNAPYGDYNETHWWGQPADGYYCLTNNATLLTKHAELLRDLGVDFVFVDVTNHAWNTGSLCDRPEEMILQPFTTLLDVWSGISGAPRVVPWVPVVASDGSHPDSKHMIYTLLEMLNAHPGIQFVYEGKPLILVTENDLYPADESKLTALSANYTVRKMWANEAKGTSKWSYMERCEESPLKTKPCFQRLATTGGSPEQIPIAMAYQADYMSHPATATPKHHGKTLRKQFETLLNNPEVPIATLTGWNEWLVGRYKCDENPLCVCSNPQDLQGCFLDQYDIEYNRDIEPGNNAMGTYYYDLVKNCISLFRAGKRCTPDNASELCCKDWQG